MVPGVLFGLGIGGSGHVLSRNSSSQYGLIFSYKYHRLSGDSPGGTMISGIFEAEGSQDASFKQMESGAMTTTRLSTHH